MDIPPSYITLVPTGIACRELAFLLFDEKEKRRYDGPIDNLPNLPNLIRSLTTNE